MSRGVRRPRALPLAAAAIVLATTLAGCSGPDDDVPGAGYVSSDDPRVLLVPAEDREPAPDLSGELVGGGEFSLAAVRGDDIVVVNVWGSWCAPCRAEAATLETVYRDLEDDGVLFVGLNTRDQTAAAAAFIRRFDVTYPNLDDTAARLQLAFNDSLPTNSIPTTWVIDREGRVAARTVSGLTEERLRAMLEPILAEAGPSSPAASTAASP